MEKIYLCNRDATHLLTKSPFKFKQDKGSKPGVGLAFALWGLWLGLAGINNSVAQTITGTPPIIHYNHKHYNGDSQFWAACQDQQGVMYFGNNDGAIVFDGERWSKVMLPNNSSVRSLVCSADGTIYAGGFNEFGVIKRNPLGQYRYETLVNMLRPEDRNFGNIWQMHDLQGTIAMRGFTQLIIIDTQKASIVKASNQFRHSEVHNGLLYIRDAESLQSFNIADLSFTNLFSTKTLGSEQYMQMLPGELPQQFYVITKQGSVYEWRMGQPAPRFVQRILPVGSNNLINCAIKTSNREVYIGTLSDKLHRWAIRNGNWVSLGTFDDLQDNTVLDLFESKEGNIWAMLNKGLDCVDPFAPLSTIFKDASTFDAAIFNNRLYLATNQGVFRSTNHSYPFNFSHKDFYRIPNMEAQAWSIQHIDGMLVCGHDRGVFVINENDSFQLIEGVGGVWKVFPVTGKPNHYFACSYDGLFVLRKTAANTLQLLNKVSGFDESSRDIQAGNQPGVYWVCHGYKGVFRIRVNDELTHVVSIEHYTNQNGLPSQFNVNVHPWQDDLVFSTNNGIFNFNAATSTFEPNTSLNKLLGTDKNIRKIITKGNRTWVVIDNEIAYFDNRHPEHGVMGGPFLSMKNTLNRSMECIVPINDSNAVIGTTLGLFAFQNHTKPAKTAPKVLFSTIDYVAGDSIFFLSSNTAQAVPELPFNFTDVQFFFSVPWFHDKNNVQFSYLLEGHGSTWSEWSAEPTKNFSHLKSGNYTFRVKARSMSGEEAQEASFRFVVRPIWYRTPVAVAGWVLVILALTYLIVRQLNKIVHKEKEKTRLEEKKLQRVLELELQQLRLEKERQLILEDKDKLEEDVIHKSKELVNYTMLLAKKRELMIEMQAELSELKVKARNDVVRSRLQDLSRRIEVNLNDEQYLQLFETNFERVHQNFFNELKAKFTDINQKELRLCAFIKMDLSNKEIASILNISVRGVETARYRLKKKLNIDADEYLSDFFEKINEAEAVE